MVAFEGLGVGGNTSERIKGEFSESIQNPAYFARACCLLLLLLVVMIEDAAAHSHDARHNRIESQCPRKVTVLLRTFLKLRLAAAIVANAEQGALLIQGMAKLLKQNDKYLAAWYFLYVLFQFINYFSMY